MNTDEGGMDSEPGIFVSQGFISSRKGRKRWLVYLYYCVITVMGQFSNFKFCCTPGRKFGYYHQSGTRLGPY